MSKNWVNFKVLCGWSGCGHPACVRLKVAERAGLGVGRGRGVEGDPGRASRKPSCSACPWAKLYPFSASASRKRPHFRWRPLKGVRARSAGQEGPGGTECERLHPAVWHVGTTGVGQTVWKRLPGLILWKPTKGLASQHSGKGGPWPRGLDTKGTWSVSDPLSDPSVLSLDKWGH